MSAYIPNGTELVTLYPVNASGQPSSNGVNVTSAAAATPTAASTFANIPAASLVGAGTRYYATDVGAGSMWVSNGTGWEGSVAQNSYYFFHGFAGGQISGDGGFYDMSGAGGYAPTQASNNVAFNNAGYVTTVATTAAAGFIAPNLNFDYKNGQKLIVWCLQKTATPGGATTFMGDGFGTSHPGIRFRANTAQMDFALSDANGQQVSSATASNCFDGTLHSFGIVIDGSGKQYQMWVDETPDSVVGSGINYASFGGGATIDTRTVTAFGIGNTPNSGTDTLAMQIRALAILRLPSTRAVPNVAQMTSIFKQLRYNPAQLLTNLVL